MKTFKQFTELSKKNKDTGAQKGIKKEVEAILGKDSVVGRGTVQDKAFVTVKVKPEDEKSIIKKLKKAGFDAHMTVAGSVRLLHIQRGGK